MASSSSASSSSVSSSRDSSSPEPPKPKAKNLKRNAQQAQNDSESDHSDSDSDSDSSEAAENDEPPLSHAERRKQKKKAAKLKAAANDSSSPSKKRKVEDGSAVATGSKKDVPVQISRQNSVWVGNLSFKTTQDNLRTFFASAGEVTRINMPTKPASRPNLPRENKGFAYVDFATVEAKTAAIALSEQPLAGRKLLIKDGDNFQGRPIAPGVEVKTNDNALAQKVLSKSAQRILKAQKQPPAPTLFVGNLPFETTEDDIRKLFEAHRTASKSAKKEEKDDDGKKDEENGEDGQEEEGDDKKKKKDFKPKTGKKDDFILKIRMGTFEDTGACKGFTFVDFSSIDDATSVLINPRNHRFNGRELKVEYAGIDAVRRGAAKHLVPAAAGSKPFKKSDGKARPPKPKAFDGDSNQAQEANDGDDAMQVDNEQQERNVRPRSSFKEERVGKKRPKARPKPGAALALAKRETAAIVQSQGKKTTF